MWIRFFSLTADWAKGKVPEDFETKLLEHYRNYLDGSGNVIPERQENFQAFLYFIDRILPSVNYEINNYKAIAKKTKLLRHCFTTTDEAFGLVVVENYSRSWIRQLEAKEVSRRARQGLQVLPEGEVSLPGDWFHARWTGSHLGNTSSGWSKEGVDRFTSLSHEINRLRADNSTGEQLEKHVRDHWKGCLNSAKKDKRPKQQIVAAYEEDLFGDHAGMLEI